jgi:MFS family permease
MRTDWAFESEHEVEGMTGGRAFAVACMGFGSAYIFSSFVGSLHRDFDASRGSVSLLFSLGGFLYFAVGVLNGPLADHWRLSAWQVYMRARDPVWYCCIFALLVQSGTSRGITGWRRVTRARRDQAFKGRQFTAEMILWGGAVAPDDPN